MKTRLIVFALLAMCTASYADFDDTLAVTADTAKIPIVAKMVVPETTPMPLPMAPTSLGRHHISLGVLGLFQSTSNDLKLLPEFDLSKGDAGSLMYRYSFDKNLDLAIDMHGWGSNETYEGVNVDMTITLIGLGVRYTFSPIGGRLFPYIQGNLGAVYEDETDKWNNVSEVYSDRAFGFVFNGGAEIKLGKRISIPIDAFYLYGKPYHDISGFGASAGISFNWGKIE